MDEFLERALTACEKFIWEYPGYAPSQQPLMPQGATNRVVRAQYQGQPVMFKFFCRTERYQRELFGLKHFGPTGLVPRVIDGSHQDLIIMSELPGTGLPLAVPGTEGLDAARASRSLGHAAGQLVQVPLSLQQARAFEQRFYEGTPLEGYLTSILRAAQAVQRSCRLYQAHVFQQSLMLVNEHLEVLLRQPRILYHQDAGNVHFLGDRVSGFFDLEMCRVGTLSMQLGSLFVLFQWDQLRWRECLDGFQTAISRCLHLSEVAASLAFAHFLVWRYITRYGEWEGQLATNEEAETEAKAAVDYATSLSYYNAIVKEARS
jgi:hypothetical protein